MVPNLVQVLGDVCDALTLFGCRLGEGERLEAGGGGVAGIVPDT